MEEKKKSRYNETSKQYSYKYKATHIRRIPFEMQKSDFDYLKGFCDSKGYRVNTFIKEAIKEKIERDKSNG